MMVLILLAIGGAAGAVARHATARTIYRRTGTAFPWGTFVVNTTGSFLLGVVVTGLAGSPLQVQLGALLAVGFLGDFTTFSTCAYEAVALARDGRRGRALQYLVGSTGAAIAAAVAGLGCGALLRD